MTIIPPSRRSARVIEQEPNRPRGRSADRAAVGRATRDREPTFWSSTTMLLALMGSRNAGDQGSAPTAGSDRLRRVRQAGAGAARGAAHADAVVDKAEPVSSSSRLSVRSARRNHHAPRLRAANDAATALLDGEDLRVFAMPLDGKAPAIADALRAETDEIAWRAQRIIGRSRPGASGRADERESESAGVACRAPFR